MITATYVNATTFTVSGDRTSEFEVGRRVRCDCVGDGFKYGTILSVSVDSVETEVVLTSASDNLTSNLTGVLYGIIGVGTNDSLPDHVHSSIEGSGGAIDGSDITFTPPSYSEIVSTNVQNAIDELDDEKMKRVTSVDNEIARFDGVGGDVQGYSSNSPTISDSGLADFPGGIKVADPSDEHGVGDRGYNDIRYARVVKHTQTGVSNTTTFTLPAGYMITAIILNSNKDIPGGVDVGTDDSAGNNGIVNAQAVTGPGRVLCTFVAGGNYNFLGVDDTIYISADNDSVSWSGVSLDITVLMMEVE